MGFAPRGVITDRVNTSMDRSTRPHVERLVHDCEPTATRPSARRSHFAHNGRQGLPRPKALTTPDDLSDDQVLALVVASPQLIMAVKSAAELLVSVSVKFATVPVKGRPAWGSPRMPPSCSKLRRLGHRVDHCSHGLCT